MAAFSLVEALLAAQNELDSVLQAVDAAAMCQFGYVPTTRESCKTVVAASKLSGPLSPHKRRYTSGGAPPVAP